MSAPAAYAAPPAADPAVQWRAIQRDLWVARRAGRHLGTVEHGRRFLATDVDGEPLGTYRTLETAMSAVEQQCPSGCLKGRRGRSWAPLEFVLTVTLAAGAMLAVSGLLLL